LNQSLWDRIVFEVLEHTADLGLRAEGKTLPEMFEAAAEGMMTIALETENIQPLTSYSISASAENMPELLVGFLNETLYLLDGQRVALRRFEVQQISPEHVEAIAWGELRDPERHRAKVVVKGVTYHQLKISHSRGKWAAEVYLDI
jgi:protein archease